MPVFTIETPGGHKLDIEAANEAGALQGAQQWYSQNGTATSGLGDAAKQGFANAMSGVGETLKQTGIAPAFGEKMKAAGAGITPAQAPDTTLVDKDGVHVSNVPRMLAEQAPSLAAVLAAAKVGARVAPGGAVGKTIGGLTAGTLAGASMIFGNKAKENAAERTGDTNAEPNSADLTRAGLTTVPEAVIGATGLGRSFFPGAGKVATTGLKGTGDAIKQLALRTGENAAAGGAQSVVSDVGKTIGTENGVSVDPVKALNSAASGGITAGVLTSPRAMSDVRGAVRDRSFGGENTEATAQVANRIQQQAVNAGNKNLKNTAAAHEAVTAAKDEITSEIKTELAALKQRNQFGLDTDNALDRATKGTATKADFAHISDATKSDPASERVVTLARQAGVMRRLLDQGVTKNGKFVGGMAAKVGDHIINPARTAAVAGGTLLASGAFPAFGVYSAPAVGAAVGAWAGLRGIDALTGARSPANRFVRKFANGGSVRPDVSATPPTPVEPDFRSQIREATDLMASRRANQKQQQNTAMPLLRELAMRAKAQANATQYQAADAANTAFDKRMSREQQQEAAALMAARRSNARLATTQDTQRGAEQADDLARQSPLIQENGGMDQASQPGFGRRARELIGAANAYRRLTAQPEEAAPEPTPAPAPVAPPPAPPAMVLPRDVASNAKTLMRGLAAMQKIKPTPEPAAPVDPGPAPVAPPAAVALGLPKDVAANAKSLMRGLATVQKIKKANGKVTEESRPQPDAAQAEIRPQPDQEQVFSPRGDHELPYMGMDHAEVADAKLKVKYNGQRVSEEQLGRERSAIIRGRSSDEALIADLASRAKGADKGTLYNVLEELHHSSSRSYTKNMREFFAAKLTPELGTELRKALSDDWIKRNKHKP